MVDLSIEAFSVTLYEVVHFSLQNRPIVELSQHSQKTCLNRSFDSVISSNTLSLVIVTFCLILEALRFI